VRTCPTIERDHACARKRLSGPGPEPVAAEHAIEGGFELGPVLLIGLLEL
jgi:hypothetical protein